MKRLGLALAASLAVFSCNYDEPLQPPEISPVITYHQTLGGSPFASAVPTSGVAWVSQFLGGTIQRYDVASGLPIGAAFLSGPSGSLPTQLSYNFGATRMFVSNMGTKKMTTISMLTEPPSIMFNTAITGDPSAVIAAVSGDVSYLGRTDGQIHKIDGSGTIVGTITTDQNGTTIPAAAGYHFTWKPGGSLLYASARGLNTSGAVYEINPTTFQVVRTIPTDHKPQGIVFSADGSRLLVATQEQNSYTPGVGGTVQVWDVGANPPVKTNTFTVACQGFGLAATSDGTKLYVGCVFEGQVVALNASTGAVIETMNVQGRPRELSFDYGTGAVVAPNESGWVDFLDVNFAPSQAGCLAQAGPPPIQLSGPRPPYSSGSLAASTKVDATAARFLVSVTQEQEINVSGGDGICWRGGSIVGQWPPSELYWDPGMHTKYAMLPGHTYGGNGIQVENVSIFDNGDGISFDQYDQAVSWEDRPIHNWIVRDVHVKYGRDDCIENDAYYSGTIESSFLEGCNTGVSSREGEHPPYTLPNSSGETITINNTLISLQSMDVTYLDPNSNQMGPSHHGFWKWETTKGPRVALNHNTFRVDGHYAGETSVPKQDFLVLPLDKIDLAHCVDNVIVWLGTEEPADPGFPSELKNENLPACITVKTAAQGGLVYWNGKVDAWRAAHPNPPDVAKPIVSMFPPPQYWPATTLPGATPTATAVDDQAVASVQFQLVSGATTYNLGTAVTQDGVQGDPTIANGYAGPTKYRLVSYSLTGIPSGSYTLQALARDASGNEMTSVGVPVTVNSPQPLLPPTNCSLQWIPMPKYLQVTWTNSGESGVSTEVSYWFNVWAVDGTASPGATSWVKTPGQGQNGIWQARVRHVKTGSTPSAYCTTNTTTVSGM